MFRKIKRIFRKTKRTLVGAYEYAKTTAIGAKKEVEYIDDNTRQVVRDLHKEGKDSEVRK